ncbi:MAG: flagellar basal body P-ring formation chaperone FlgA [Ferrovibrio sp.]|jgi:flagella basal body P-ring formation protein FlgA|uniref:flagellar basal body P-ring formation chaperone FlgA n=1 Tax=Ferrovibrio sp. TaxID=1917215 RepID=UPI00391AEF17
MASLRTLLLAGFATAAMVLPMANIPPAAAQTQVASVGGGAGRVIGEREVARRIAELVQQRNGGQPVDIYFHGMDNYIEVPATAQAVLQVESFSFDSRSGRFMASLTTPGRNEAVRFSGRAQNVESLPVLKNRVAAGETITKSDIEWIRVPAGRYGGGYIDRVEDLIGHSPRRPLAAGRPLRTSDIGKPEVITKNGLVTMVAQGPGLTITTTGRAMEAGSMGDVIQVMNVQSKKTVQATVIGLNQVQVITAPNMIVSN